ncbi:Lrp/AsnC family transcriptional regulator [Candidatus Bathyarchaeota archaeon]|jgi:DNA-binding Lrp family transcriptional regulator|nr:Lrp/AsnC family transcriptional regulator [Candidatus Bathyarchaeota archaeon]
MLTAYIMMNAELGSEKEVMDRIESYPEVIESYILYGVYDILVKVRVNNREELSRLVTRKIRGKDDIKNTITFIVINEK